jgi:hypothetical protein
MTVTSIKKTPQYVLDMRELRTKLDGTNKILAELYIEFMMQAKQIHDLEQTVAHLRELNTVGREG